MLPEKCVISKEYVYEAMEQGYGEVHSLISKNLSTRKMSLNDCYVINLGQEKIVLSLCKKDLNQ